MIGGEFNELFPADRSRWTNVQNVSPNNGRNGIGLTSTPVSEGERALRLLAFPGDDVPSKVDIETTGFFAPAGSTVTFGARPPLPRRSAQSGGDVRTRRLARY